MSTVLGANNYGKAETRLVWVGRDGGEHELVDLTVGVALAGDLAETHLTGDNANVLPTDTQKNTVYAFARRYGVGQIEDFGLRLARHFVHTQPAIRMARIEIEQHAWRRLGPHSFAREGGGTRRAALTYDGEHTHVLSGVSGLVLLNSTGSEFHGFARDQYTTLAEAHDRVLATAVDAWWRHDSPSSEGAEQAGWPDWAASFASALGALVDTFVGTHSLSLQQTLYAMGAAVVETCPGVPEIRLSLPNRHHYLVELDAFGLDNPGTVFHAADRPYGLIEGTVLRADAAPAPLAWSLPR